MQKTGIETQATIAVAQNTVKGIHLREEGECPHCHGQAQGDDHPLSSLLAMIGLQTKHKKVYKPTGGATIAWQVNRSQGVVSFGFAVCTEKDQYNRSLGFHKAKDRLMACDLNYSMSLKIDDVLDVAKRIMAKDRGMMEGLKKSFFDNIKFDDLSEKIVKHVMIVCMNSKLDSLKRQKAQAREELKVAKKNGNIQ
jgi:hypothetical protein